jgi:hypothetical protein
VAAKWANLRSQSIGDLFNGMKHPHPAPDTPEDGIDPKYPMQNPNTPAGQTPLLAVVMVEAVPVVEILPLDL